MPAAVLLDPSGLSRLHRALEAAGFRGDFEDDVGARTVAATDNSIYQVEPSAIVYPRDGKDLQTLVRVVADIDDPSLTLTARGGGTGTNGQSLNSGLIVDFARHMNRILKIDVEAHTVTVEPGVVLGQLQAALAPHGLSFPPMVSTASRATLGGMVATDASGKGSRRYGKTSDYIAALELVLADGESWRAEPMTMASARQLAKGEDTIAAIHREVVRVVTSRADTIAAVFPDMNRGLTGYNLQKAWDASADVFSLAYLLAGSEGTLALTREITFNVTPAPRHRTLVVLRYDEFAAGIEDVEHLLDADPVAVEILDDKVMSVARDDVIWNDIESVLGADTGTAIGAVNFVEFAEIDPAALDARVVAMKNVLNKPMPGRIDATFVHDPIVISRLWTLREKAVGLLGRLGGGLQGIPFVEDTAVPPERLSHFVTGFRAILEEHGLKYGMFGHADVGCLHVRPFIDMKDPAQAALIRPISDAVAALVKSHGGLLWGEHGRGFRGEYSPFFFGPELYPELERIKAAFDPLNRLNPGKLAAPAGGKPLESIDKVPFRGSFDAQLTTEMLEEFDRAVACNGNGACFSWDALTPLCPSYKATRDRAQSPKGRATLLRAWARAEAIEGDPRTRRELETAVHASLETCLSCKACTTLCPIKVDVPTMRSNFLSRYHARHGRPWRHHVLGVAEAAFAIGRRLPWLANAALRFSPVPRMLERYLGFVDVPKFVPSRGGYAPIATPASVAAIAPACRDRLVLIVEDTFTASFDGAVPETAARLLTTLGYEVLRVPAAKNGKILHILGLKERFAGVASARIRQVSLLAQHGARLVGLDAASALMHEHEYRTHAGEKSVIRVIGIEELLANDIAAGKLPTAAVETDQDAYLIFGHCTEQALRPRAQTDWANIFTHFGLAAKPVRTGCCGMAGLFGHEAKNQTMSRELFDLSWKDNLPQDRARMLATGYSCRAQTHRLDGSRPSHPIEALAAHMLNRVVQ